TGAQSYPTARQGRGPEGLTESRETDVLAAFRLYPRGARIARGVRGGSSAPCSEIGPVDERTARSKRSSRGGPTHEEEDRLVRAAGTGSAAPDQRARGVFRGMSCRRAVGVGAAPVVLAPASRLPLEQDARRGQRQR